MRTIDADALVDAMTGACNIFDAHGVDTTIARTLITVAAKAPTVGGWTSVKDRLPEKSGDYIAYTKDELVWPYFFQRNVGWEDGLGYRTETVTHWMPLPEPPKEVNMNDAKP